MIAARVVKKEIEQMGSLPTIPTIVGKVLQMCENPKVSLAEMASIIAQDPVLAAKILKVINSPIYGFPGRISSLTQALLLLGLNVARGLLIGVSVLEIMQKSLLGLWEHSVGCAIVARIIATRKGLKDPEETSVAGLLHDIGKVFLSLKFPYLYKQVVSYAGARLTSISEVEKEFFEVTHAEVQSWIGSKWNFPSSLVEQMAFHHRPHLSKNCTLQTAIVHFSDILIRARGFGFAGDQLVPAVNEAAWQLLELSDAEIREILIEMEGALEQAEDLLLTGRAA